MRAIAAEAGVDPSVVVHFFGSKDGLFRAAVGWPFDPEVVAAHLAEPRREGLAATLARAFLTLYEDQTTGPALLATLRSAMSHPTSAALLREFVAKQLFTHVSGRLQGADAALRLNLAASHLVGVAILRYAFRIEPIASVTVDELVGWLEPTLARYLESGGDAEPPEH